MSQAASIYRAKWDSPLPKSFSKSERVSTSELWTKSILSFPDADLAGDVVVQKGIDWTLHQRDPGIDLEHGREPGVGGLPVAWARKSLSEPGAPYAVEKARLNFGGDGQPDRWEDVWVGTDYFDKSCPLSMQVFALREQDVFPCSSLEFKPVKGFMKSLGKSPLEPRNAYRFDRCEVVRWTICRKGVCPNAMTLTKSISSAHAPQVHAGLSKILQDERVCVGGTFEKLHPYIRKALAPAAEPKRTTVTVRVEKGMNDDTTTQPAATPDADLDTQSQNAVEEMSPEQGPTPTAKDAYDLAQAASDLCAQVKAGHNRREHKGGRKKLMALCEKLETISEMAMEIGKQVDADLGDDSGAEPEGNDNSELEGDDEESDEEPPEEKQEKALRKARVQVTPADMVRDEDGVLAGIPATVKKSVKRFTLREYEAATTTATAEVKKAPEIKTDDAERIAHLEDAVGKLVKKMGFL